MIECLDEENGTTAAQLRAQMLHDSELISNTTNLFVHLVGVHERGSVHRKLRTKDNTEKRTHIQVRGGLEEATPVFERSQHDASLGYSCQCISCSQG